MAKRVFSVGNQTFAGTATGAAATQWLALKGANGTQIIDCLEFLISGMATSSIVAPFMTAYSSTLGVTPTALASPGQDGPMVVSATALSATVIAYFAAGTGPVPAASVTLPKLNLGLNVFGGIIRWNAAPTQQWTMVGNATNGGESVLWNNATAGPTTSAAANAHIIYEPY
jgi:hypothetical protein